MLKQSKFKEIIANYDDAAALWASYKETGSKDLRNQLVLIYSPLVKYVASRVGVNLPPNVEQQDLISYGFFGLLDAIDKFDLDRNIKFETYAITRIRGAIIDELRSMDWMPRSLRSKAKEIEKAYVVLESKFKRMPSDDELAKEMGINTKELDTILTKLSYGSVIALDDMCPVQTEKSYEKSIINNLEDSSGDNPINRSEFHELKHFIASAIMSLPDKEKMVVSLYYYEGLTMREIGMILGVTESRASQLHTKAILYLKAKLQFLNDAEADI